MTKGKAKHTAFAVISFMMLAGPDLAKLLEGNFSSWKDAVRGVLGWAIAFCTSGKAVAFIGTLFSKEGADEKVERRLSDVAEGRKPDSGFVNLLFLIVVASVAAVFVNGVWR